jgi:hypothetical protein
MQRFRVSRMKRMINLPKRFWTLSQPSRFFSRVRDSNQNSNQNSNHQDSYWGSKNKYSTQDEARQKFNDHARQQFNNTVTWKDYVIGGSIVVGLPIAATLGSFYWLENSKESKLKTHYENQLDVLVNVLVFLVAVLFLVSLIKAMYENPSMLIVLMVLLNFSTWKP